jgi:hypothetical protein
MVRLNPADFAILAPAAPFALGLCIGFVVAVMGVWRWYAGSAAGFERNLVTGFKRQTVQALLLGIALTVFSAGWLSLRFTGHTNLQTIQGALCGLPFGLAAGVSWVWRRGER